MSKKRKSGKGLSSSQLFEQAQRELAKGNAKEALKSAKICFRSDPSEPHRQLLERAYLSRVENLIRIKLTAEAKSVLAELIALKPTLPEVQAKLPRLNVLVGNSNVDSAAVFAANPELLCELVDRAILDFQAVPPAFEDIPGQVSRMREALVAVERGDDAGAAELVQAIPRNSPLADWKLFLRGLSAFYRRDDERTRQNWQRLDARRPAHRIARTLLVGTGMLPESEAGTDATASLQRLERILPRDPAAESLQELSVAWREGDLQAFMRDFRRFCQRFAKSHSGAIGELVEMAWKRAASSGNKRALDQLREIAPPPPLDPHWNRALALLAENSRARDLATVEDHWRRYARDVAQVECLREDERQVAASLVHVHLARTFEGFAQRCERGGPFRSPDMELVGELRAEAIRCYRRGMEACPRLRTASWELAKLHESEENLAEAAAVLEDLLRRQPDDFDASCWLANYYVGCDEPGQAEKHVEAAARLKPRDPSLVTLRWNQRIAMVRGLAKARQFEAARQELEEAIRIAPPGIEPYLLDTMRAGIEFKARNRESAERYVADAVGRLEEPTAVWLQMSQVAARYSLPREIKKEFDNRFKASIKKHPTSQTAGRLARALLTLHLAKINYTGRATQERLVLDYLHRAAELNWNEHDLLDAVRFLALLPRQQDLHEELVDKGVEQFPDNPHFHAWQGLVEVKAGPYGSDFAAAEWHLRHSLELNEQAAVKMSGELVEQVQTALAMVDQVRDSMFPFGYDEDDLDDDYEDDDDDVDEYGYEDEGSPFAGMDTEEAVAIFEQAIPQPLLEILRSAAESDGISLKEAIGSFIAEEVAREEAKAARGGAKAKQR